MVMNRDAERTWSVMRGWKIRLSVVKVDAVVALLVLGLASLAPLLVPGILYSLSPFLHYQGDIMQCGLGKPFNIPTSKLGTDQF